VLAKRFVKQRLTRFGAERLSAQLAACLLLDAFLPGSLPCNYRTSAVCGYAGTCAFRNCHTQKDRSVFSYTPEESPRLPIRNFDRPWTHL